MKIERLNFEDIKYQFYLERTAPKASRLLKTQSEEELFDLLRHHDQKRISDDETWKRDYFDYLLAYYSMLEIALMIGFVYRLPLADQKLAIEELSHPALSRYYKKHYRLKLPSRLLRRLQKGFGEQVENTDGRTTGLFMEFMTLTNFLETDEDIETFLWFLDGGVREEYWYEDTLKVLRSTESLARSMSKPMRKKDELDYSVEGFVKFLSFCIQLDALLRSCTKWPALRRAMYDCHAYWFVRMRKLVAESLDRALRAYVEVESRDGYSADFTDPREALKRLLSDAYER